MRDRHTVANCRGADPFPLLQNAKNLLSVQVIVLIGQPGSKFFERGIFLAADKCRNDGLNVDKIDDLHTVSLPPDVGQFTDIRIDDCGVTYTGMSQPSTNGI